MAIATSYERTRTNAYSEDLRWRITYQQKALSYSLQCVAENLGVGVATVHRIETLFYETGSVGKRKYPDGHGTHKLTENDKVLILGLLVERPETYLHEIQRELQALNGTDGRYFYYLAMHKSQWIYTQEAKDSCTSTE